MDGARLPVRKEMFLFTIMYKNGRISIPVFLKVNDIEIKKSLYPTLHLINNVVFSITELCMLIETSVSETTAASIFRVKVHHYHAK
jgi:hypothetical protein